MLELKKPFIRMITSIYFDPEKLIPVYDQLTNLNMLIDDLEDGLML